MPRQVINRRETAKRHTRHALEEAAMALFARQGYENTTVEEIAAMAGVSVRTFFRYFSSKQHVLFGDVAFDRVATLTRALHARPAVEGALEAVRATLDSLDITDPVELDQVRARMRLMSEQPALMNTYLSINRELERLIADFAAQRSGLPAMHPYPLTIAAAAAASWDVALTSWLHGTSDDLGSARRDAFARLTAGVVTKS